MSITDAETYGNAIDCSIQCLKRVAWSEGRFAWVEQGCSKQLAARIKDLIDVRVASWSIRSLISFNKVSEAHQMKCRSQYVSLL
jgi:hypothetical protein